MSIGDKNRLIDIYRPGQEYDDANEPIGDGWVFVKSKWANMRGESGLATIRAAASAGGVNTPLDRYSFRFNYDLTLNVTMQLRDPEGTRYNVIAVRHDKADRDWTDVVGETGGSDG